MKTLKSLSKTKWAYQAEAAVAVKNHYKAIITALEGIILQSDLPEVKAKAQGPKLQMNTFEFIFCLEMMIPILNMILKMSQTLQMVPRVTLQRDSRVFMCTLVCSVVVIAYTYYLINLY